MLRYLAVFVLVVALAAPAAAQSRRELAARIDGLEARLAEIEAQALQGDPVAETLMSRMDALEREQRVLTGEIERLAFENRQMRRELERLDVSVEDLLSAPVSLGAGPALLSEAEIDPNDPFAAVRAGDVQPLQAPDSEGTEVSELAAPAQAQIDPEAVFTSGRARLLDGDFGGAQDAFETYTTQFPEGDQIGEAWYWLGETHFINGSFEQAADAYIASLRSDRQGARGPDALVRLGASLDALGETVRACQVLATFPQEFPNASDDARRKAQREVSRIGCS